MAREKPIVGIIMGSKSDFEVMKQAQAILNEFGVGSEIRVVSAHRTPEMAFEYAKGAKGRGIEVIIAGAGGAAHLAGVTAALTTIPVIGIPLESKSLKGIDSLLSTVQMPGGVPVATVGIGNAKNAGLLACRILSLSRPEIAQKLGKYAQDTADNVRQIKL